jgi:hypothetical protein
MENLDWPDTTPTGRKLGRRDPLSHNLSCGTHREIGQPEGLMNRTIAVVLLSCGVILGPVSAQQPKVNPDAQLLQNFKKGVDAYMEIHRRLEKKAPPLKETDDPAKIKASQDGLAALIRAERTTAKKGDLFTPEIAQLFRRLMYPEIKGEQGKETKAAIKEDAPNPKAVPLKVNARYPDSVPLPTVPPNLLANLPQLPKELEYRIVGNDLILRDVQANLIVDFIPRAIR